MNATTDDTGTRDAVDLRAPEGIGGGVEGPASRLTTWFDERLNRLGLRSALARDGLLAVSVALFSCVMLWSATVLIARVEDLLLSPTTVAVLLLLTFAQSRALWTRRVNPLLCLVVVTLAQVGTIVFLPPHVAAQGIAPLIAAYTCGTLLPPRRLAWVLASVTLLHVLAETLLTGALSDPLLDPEALVVRPSTFGEHLMVVLGQLVITAAVYVGSALVGVHTATRRRFIELTRVRAAEVIQRQRERAEGAIMAERARMARELHDIAAHHLSGMVVQAGAAERLVGRDDQAAREAMSWVRSQGRETLRNLRLIVGALRDPGEEAASSGDGLSHSGAPVPGAAAIERLVRAERALGCSVELVLEGETYELPPVADVTVYRVAQESLSNAREHAPNAPVRLRLEYRDSRVVLQVDNGTGDGGKAAKERTEDAPRGLGLLGMRERAHLVGADLEAGPTLGGGWRVRLELPVDRETSSSSGTVSDTGGTQ